ncbi:UDP-3-O-(3-hydroxymyristoyl)glucosamine N-acyltransferase [Saccharospirillum sp. MSK14-1]|uniref:UDP-3-O-(3-hydroxymyristoyl)glucosamine N-acyltransferase n=1 Tax=Saccharospirillum sp. MSK14-1 TaxID=1897632 RepID=UPI000D3931EB|nr:UDP-3-O-(3-hydroxymyristoyl)glucosamine N-acyltransferase [Saccharospirillum sp. MSK14-1]
MLTARTLAQLLGAQLQGAADQWDQPLTKPASLDKAVKGELTFLSSAKYRRQLADCAASAILLNESAVSSAPADAALLVVDDPYRAYARASREFSREPQPYAGVHPSAVVAEGVVIGDQVSIGAQAVIEAGCHLADGVVIGAGCYVGAGVLIGQRTRLMPNVTVHYGVTLGEDCRIHSGTVLGGDGFGFAPAAPGWERIAQLGGVTIGNRVDIGSNCTVDRGAIDDTVIDDDVIIDNLVQLGHNVHLGQGVAMVSQSGVAGSTEVGAGCTIGGQTGVNGHIKVLPGTHFTGQSMVTKAPAEPGVYSSGWPLQPNTEWRRTVVRLQKLDKLEQRLKKLEQQAASAADEEDSE